MTHIPSLLGPLQGTKLTEYNQFKIIEPLKQAIKEHSPLVYIDKHNYTSAISKTSRNLGHGKFGVILMTKKSHCLKTIQSREPTAQEDSQEHYLQEVDAWEEFLNEIEIYSYVQGRLYQLGYKNLEDDDNGIPCKDCHILTIKRVVGFFIHDFQSQYMRIGLEMSEKIPLKKYLKGRFVLKTNIKDIISNKISKENYDTALKLIDIFIDMNEGLLQLHKIGIIHNDLAMRNYLVDPVTEKVVLIDLGLASYYSKTTFTDEEIVNHVSQQTLDQLSALESKIQGKYCTSFSHFWSSPDILFANTEHSDITCPSHLLDFSTDTYQLATTYGEILYNIQFLQKKNPFLINYVSNFGGSSYSEMRDEDMMNFQIKPYYFDHYTTKQKYKTHRTQTEANFNIIDLKYQSPFYLDPHTREYLKKFQLNGLGVIICHNTNIKRRQNLKTDKKRSDSFMISDNLTNIRKYFLEKNNIYEKVDWTEFYTNEASEKSKNLSRRESAKERTKMNPKAYHPREDETPPTEKTQPESYFVTEKIGEEQIEYVLSKKYTSSARVRKSFCANVEQTLLDQLTNNLVLQSAPPKIVEPPGIPQINACHDLASKSNREFENPRPNTLVLTENPSLRRRQQLNLTGSRLGVVSDGEDLPSDDNTFTRGLTTRQSITVKHKNAPLPNRKATLSNDSLDSPTAPEYQEPITRVRSLNLPRVNISRPLAQSHTRPRKTSRDRETPRKLDPALYAKLSGMSFKR